MNALSNTLAVAGKELAVFLKDRGALAVFFLMPLVFAVFFGQIGRMLGADEAEAPAINVDVVFVNLDDGPYGRRVAQAVAAVPVLTVEAASAVDEADERVAAGDAAAAVILPAGFSRSIDDHTPSEVLVIVDPVQAEGAGIVSGIMNQVVAEVGIAGEITYGIRAVLADTAPLGGAGPEAQRAAEAQILGVIMAQLDEMRQNPIIEVASEDLEGVEPGKPFDPFTFNLPAFMTMFAFFLMGTIAAGLLTEKENGTFRRLLASPIHRGSIIGGKVLAYMVVVFLQALVLFGVGRVFFGMYLGESALGLGLLTLALAFCATALGMLLATVARTPKQADDLGVVIALVLAGLGGCIAIGTIFFRNPGNVMYYVSNMTPHAHALQGYLKLFWDGAGAVDILPQVGVLLAMGVAFFLIAMRRFRFT